MINKLKEALHQLCVEYVRKRMNEAESAIKEAQDAANNETKSSAGDKYETGRAMMQQETNRNLAQLNEANKLLVALNQVSTNGTSEVCETGSVVNTTNGKFYIAISAGPLLYNGETYFAVSPASPIGMKLNGMQVGNAFSLNGRQYEITSIQ